MPLLNHVVCMHAPGHSRTPGVPCLLFQKLLAHEEIVGGLSETPVNCAHPSE